MSLKLRNFSDFIKVLQSHPANSIALVNYANGQTFSYSEMLKAVEIVSGKLADIGIKKTDRVVLFKIPDIDWVIHFLAIQCLQAIVVPLDDRLHLDTVRSIESKVQPNLIISNSYQSHNKIKTIKPFSCSKTSEPKISLDKLLSTFSDKDIISQIILTSGTWSEPKGVTLTQQNIMANLTATTTAFKGNPQERLLSLLPLSHGYEQMCGLFMPLYFGASIVYLDELTPITLKQALVQHKITYMIVVPKVLELLKKGILKKIPKQINQPFDQVVKSCRFFPSWISKFIFASIHKNLAPQLKYLVVGGAPLNLDLDHFFQGLGYQVIVGYGLSETSPVISFDNNQRLRTPQTVGRILKNLKVKFNHKGELLVSGPSVFKGYWPESRTQKWFNTGDVGYLDKANKLILTGRTKNLLIFPSGDKLSLEDIEQLVNQFSQVEESCVLHHPKHLDKGINLLVYSPDLDSKALLKFVNQKLPLAAQVKSVFNIYPKKLIRTHTQKLSRSKNWQEYSSLLDSKQPKTATDAAS